MPRPSYLTVFLWLLPNFAFALSQCPAGVKCDVPIQFLVISVLAVGECSRLDPKHAENYASALGAYLKDQPDDKQRIRNYADLNELREKFASSVGEKEKVELWHECDEILRSGSIDHSTSKSYIKDDSASFAGFKILAEIGDAFAQYNLGLMYENGRGVPQDYKQAVTQCKNGITRLGDEYMANSKPEILDDTGQKLIVAQMMEGKGDLKAAAINYCRILESRLSILADRR